MVGLDKQTLNALKQEYPVGTTVELVKMDDILAPPAGTKGKVIGIDDIGTIFVSWENGSRLGVAYGEDEIRKI